MIDFLETPRFPDKIGFHSTGSTQFNTDVIVLKNGFEQRNARWSYPLHRFDIASGIKNAADLSAILHFFNSVRGRFMGFRFKDWLDYSSSPTLGNPIAATDQVIATGDGKQREFALIKMYTVGEHSQIRRIQKPVENTVVVAINGVTDPRFTVNTVNGLVALSEEYDPPQPDDIITAGFEFDVPCRFDTDQLTIGLHHQTLGSFTIPLVEMRFF
jgi:uncharacterized protein (TIGR02217 family)